MINSAFTIYRFPSVFVLNYMKELQEILKKIAVLKPDEKAVLATVVDVKGSSYRRAGARMLIGADGETIGTVSGGCLEADVLERAKKVWGTGAAEVFVYDTTATEDSVFSLNMGCRGVIRILLEPARDNAIFEFLQNCVRQRKACAVTTLIAKSESFSLPIGAKFLVRAETDWSGETNPIIQNVLSDAAKALADNRKFSKIYEADSEMAEFFIESIFPPINLLLFGAGYDAISLADFAANLGWRVTLIDHRPAWASAERFPSAAEIIVSRAENLNENLFRDEISVAVLMTHNYEADREILYRLLNSSCRYVGALGPKKRTENLIAELRRAGKTFDESKLNRLYAPIGLDIGAESPEEIALAIIAEIRSVLSNREAGFLRARQGGIH
ncbi:MAG TPA: XdhC/CoxI family protein [Pyrinomonadaceae bacterium]|jgi:xanthine/CO dehydrogenase XdhC/CoxF family maturation factor